MKRAMRLLMGVLLLSSACAKVHDPTAIFAPLPSAPAVGVQLKLGRQGDGQAAVTNVWVEDAGGNNIYTISTTDGLNVLSVPAGTPSSSFCSAGMAFYWPSYCAGNPNNYTDANSHATSVYLSDTALFFTWDWHDRNGALVPNGTYTLKAELSGYDYEPSGFPIAAEASVTVSKNGSPGTATGTVTGAWQNASATWNP